MSIEECQRRAEDIDGLHIAKLIVLLLLLLPLRLRRGRHEKEETEHKAQKFRPVGHKIGGL